MFRLKFMIYFICFLIFVHFVLHFFDIDVFELFEKPMVDSINEEINHSCSVEISESISELEKSIQELKDVSNI